MGKIITNSKKETQKLAENFAKKILEKTNKNKTRATVLSLYGNLGAGKTTFTQGFAKGLGISQNIISPTFVILKMFKITKKLQNANYKLQTISKLKIQKNTKQKTQDANFQNLIHIDAYRLENPKEILVLNWEELINNPQNIILIEWADKIKKILPKNHIKINFKFINENKREVIISKIF